LDAVADTSVFVEINTEDEHGHPCIRLAAGAAHDAGCLCQSDYWDGMPGSRMPVSRRRLEQGVTHVVRRDAPVGVEAETYAASRVGSELDVPIFAGGEWVGLVGLLSEGEDRDWSSEIPMMRILGTLIAARFEQTGIPPVMAL
jgi:hypothetical protein